jgi:branched-chain amino acid transport system substrate-binding protein
LAFVTAVLTALTAGAQEARDFFKVGVIAEISGSNAVGGNIIKRGYDMWATAVNAEGGIQIGGKKYKVQLVYGDSQSNPSQGASAVERLITQEHVDFIFGPYTSMCTIAMGPVCDKYEVPVVGGAAESPMIYLQKFKYTFGTLPPVNFTGAGCIGTLSKLNPPPKTAVVIGANDTFSKATAETFRDGFEKVGIKVLRFDIVPDEQDLTPLLSVMKNMHPDILAFGSRDEELIKMVKNLRQINFNPKIVVMHYGVTDPSFTEALKADANQIYGVTIWTDTSKNTSKYLWKNSAEYEAAANKAYGCDGDYTQAGCSVSGIAYQVALQKIKATPPLSLEKRRELQKALEEVDVMTFLGRIKFASEGQFYHANTYIEPLTVQVQDGKCKVVGPPSMAEAKAIYPMTPWAQR